MNNDNEYRKFRENIRFIINEELDNLLSQKNIYVTYAGTIMSVNKTENPFEQICSVDLVFTNVTNLLNKSGQILKIGDSVIVFEKVGSHLSNCFIAYKNAI